MTRPLNRSHDPSYGLGIHSLSSEERRNNCLVGAVARGYIPYQPIEELYLFYLNKLGIPDSDIVPYLNSAFHEGRNVRNVHGIQGSRVALKRRFTSLGTILLAP